MSRAPEAAPEASGGGGLAGLAAAARLRAHGVRAVVFDARAAPGGRVRTASHPRGRVDLGATWFHGTAGNAAYDVAAAARAVPAPPAPSPAPDPDLGALVFATPGVAVSPRGHVRRLEPACALRVAALYADALRAAARRLPPADPAASLLALVRAAARHHALTPLERAVFRARDLLESCVNGCDASTARVSAARFADYATLPGGNAAPARAGMAAVVSALMARLDYSQLVLRAEVTAVRWDPPRARAPARAPAPPSDRVRLDFADGTSVRAACALWTPSLNVTKAAVAAGRFHPPLPPAKLAALAHREQGTVEKVFAVLSAPLRNVPANAPVPVVWEGVPAEAGAELHPVPHNHTRSHSAPHDWRTSVYALTYDDELLHVAFWLTGHAGKTVAAMSQHRARREISALLSMLYQQPVHLQHVLCSNWGNDPFFLGSYSFPAVGCPEGAVEQLAEPLPSPQHPVLFFAGEATHPSFYSTMHGAVESGYREADRIAAFLSTQVSTPPPNEPAVE